MDSEIINANPAVVNVTMADGKRYRLSIKFEVVGVADSGEVLSDGLPKFSIEAQISTKTEFIEETTP